MASMRQSRPNCGPGFQVKVLKLFKGVPFLLGSGGVLGSGSQSVGCRVLYFVCCVLGVEFCVLGVRGWGLGVRDLGWGWGGGGGGCTWAFPAAGRVLLLGRRVSEEYEDRVRDRTGHEGQPALTEEPQKLGSSLRVGPQLRSVSARAARSVWVESPSEFSRVPAK